MIQLKMRRTFRPTKKSTPFRFQIERLIIRCANIFPQRVPGDSSAAFEKSNEGGKCWGSEDADFTFNSST